jgi:thiamine biosynthesis lipoprotein
MMTTTMMTMTMMTMMMTTTMTTMTTTIMMNTMTRFATQAVPAWAWQMHAFRAMNSAVQISFAGPRPALAVRRVEETFRYFEGLLSRFRPQSELSQFNNGREPAFGATLDFYAAVEAALWAAAQTDGIYDPTILPALVAAGYDRSFEQMARPRPLLAGEGQQGSIRPTSVERLNHDYRSIGLDPLATLIYRPVGLRLDLGGMGKGWTVDRTADDLCARGHFLLNAGGDLYAYGDGIDGRGWEVRLGHPWQPEQAFAMLRLTQHAVATSTVARRRWLHDDKIQHHLIDPRTGCPAESDVISVAVVAGRVFMAEVWAKTALILGLGAGLAFLEGLPEVEGVLFTANGTVHHTGGMDALLERLEPTGF